MKDSFLRHLEEREEALRKQREPHLAEIAIIDEELGEIKVTREQYTDYLNNHAAATNVPPISTMPPKAPKKKAKEEERRGLRETGLTRVTFELLSSTSMGLTWRDVADKTGQNRDAITAVFRRAIDDGYMVSDESGRHTLTIDGLNLLRRSIPYKGSILSMNQQVLDTKTATQPENADRVAVLKSEAARGGDYHAIVA